MLIEIIASNSLGEAIRVCLGSDLQIMTPSEIVSLLQSSCIKANLQRKMFLSLTFVFFYYFLKFLVEFYDILLLLVHCSSLLRVAPKVKPCFLQGGRQTC